MAKFELVINNPGRAPIAYFTDHLSERRFKAAGETRTQVLTQDVELVVADLRAKQPALKIEILKDGKPVKLKEIVEEKKEAEKAEAKAEAQAEAKKKAEADKKKSEESSKSDKKDTGKSKSSDDEKGSEDAGKSDKDDSEPAKRGPGRPPKSEK